MKNAQTIVAMVLASASLVACGGKGQQADAPNAAKKTGAVVARIGDEVITADELAGKMKQRSPFMRARFDTAERKKAFLDNEIRFMLLAQEAKRRGLQNDPDVVAATRKAMVQTLMRTEFSNDKALPPVSEEEMKAFYQDNIHDFVKPERVRLSHVFFAAKKGAADRAKVKAEATKALATLKAKDPTDRNAFADLAKTRSDDAASKRAGGDLSYETKEELTAKWGEELAKAVFEAKNVGDLGGVVATDKGFHIFKVTGRQNALNRPFETVKGQIESRLAREKRTHAFDEFVEGLKAKSKVEIDEKALAEIDLTPEPSSAKGGAVAGKAGATPPQHQAVQPVKPVKMVKPTAHPVPAKAMVPATKAKARPAAPAHPAEAK